MYSASSSFSSPVLAKLKSDLHTCDNQTVSIKPGTRDNSSSRFFTWRQLNVLDVCWVGLRLSDPRSQHLLSHSSDCAGRSAGHRGWRRSPQRLQDCRAPHGGSGGRHDVSPGLNDRFRRVHLVDSGAGRTANAYGCRCGETLRGAGGSLHRRPCECHRRYTLRSLVRGNHSVFRARRGSPSDCAGSRWENCWAVVARSSRSVVDTRHGGLRFAAAVNRCAPGDVTVYQHRTSIQSLHSSRSAFVNSRRYVRHRGNHSTGNPGFRLRLRGCHTRSSRRRGPGWSIHARSVGTCTVNVTSPHFCWGSGGNTWKQDGCLATPPFEIVPRNGKLCAKSTTISLTVWQKRTAVS